MSPMISAGVKKSSSSNNPERKLSIEAQGTAVSSKRKRQRLHRGQRSIEPPEFWDSLSRLWLIRSALREFDRRTVWPAFPPRPRCLPDIKEIDGSRLENYARYGGPKLSDLRGYQDPEDNSSSIRSMPPKVSKSPQEDVNVGDTTSPYSPAFEQLMIDSGVFPDGHGGYGNAPKPGNIDEILARLQRDQTSVSPSNFTDDDFVRFLDKNDSALTESTVVTRVFPTFLGETHKTTQQDLLFCNLEKITTTESNADAKPDSYDGSPPESLRVGVRDELSKYIVPSTTITTAPCLPNFFVEAEDPSGDPSVVRRQALYDGALGARAMHKLQTYANPKVGHDGKAYTIAMTYSPSNGSLHMYATHPGASNISNGRTDYWQTRLRQFAMIDRADRCREGLAAVRNAREWAKEQRDKFIAAANTKADGGAQ